MFNILIAEDDKNTKILMEDILENAGYNPFSVSDGEEALSFIQNNPVDLIILDVMMPKMDGYELVRLLREDDNNVPVIMVTAKVSANDKKRGFIAGVDDYMVKPFDEEEMLLRISALLRRAGKSSEHRVILGNTVIDYDGMTVKSGGQEFVLPQKEFMMLFMLASYPGRIFKRSNIMDAVWDTGCETDQHTVDVHINRLRDKFRDSDDFEIITVRGIGYKLEKK